MYEYSCRVIRCVDGDTVDLDIDLGCNVHIYERCRLYGINAPETYGVSKDSEEYKAGTKAKEWLKEILEGKEIIIRTIKDKKGKYGRYLVTIPTGSGPLNQFIEFGETTINQIMIDKGLAEEYIL